MMARISEVSERRNLAAAAAAALRANLPSTLRHHWHITSASLDSTDLYITVDLYADQWL